MLKIMPEMQLWSVSRTLLICGIFLLQLIATTLLAAGQSEFAESFELPLLATYETKRDSSDPPEFLALSPDQSHAAFNRDEDVVFFDLNEGIETFSVPISMSTSFTAWSQVVDFSPGGDRIAVSSEAGVQVWDLEKSSMVYELQTEHGGTDYLGFDPSGERLAFLRSVTKLATVDAMSGQIQWEYHSPYDYLKSPSFTKNGRQIAIIHDNALHLLSSNLGEVESKFDIPEGPRQISTNPNSNGLVVGDETGFLHFWDGDPERKVSEIKLNAWVKKAIGRAHFRISSDGKAAFVGDVPKKMFVHTSDGRVRPLTISQSNMIKIGGISPPISIMSDDGSRLIVLNRSGQLFVFGMPADNWLGHSAEIELNVEERATVTAAIRQKNVSRLVEYLNLGITSLDFDPPLLQVAAEEGDAQVIDALVSAGADVNKPFQRTGLTPLHSAVLAENEETISALLGVGASIDYVGPSGQTFYSALIRSGIDPNGASQASKLKNQIQAILDSKDISALLLDAIKSGNRNLALTMIDLGASTTPSEELSKDALVIAALSRAPDAASLVEDLVFFGGADPKTTRSNGLTPLAIAMSSDVPRETLSYLVSVSDLSWRTNNGLNYWELAEEMQNRVALDVLPPETVWPETTPWPDFLPWEVKLNGTLSRSDLLAAQEKLTRKGLYASTIDGIWGPATRRALAAYYKVFLDDYSKKLSETCATLRQDVENRINQMNSWDTDIDLRGFLVSFHGQSDEPTVRVYNLQSNAAYECHYRRSDSILTSWAGVYWDAAGGNEPYIQANFNTSCKHSDNIIGTSLENNDGVLAADFVCRDLVAGVPRQGQISLTAWGNY